MTRRPTKKRPVLDFEGLRGLRVRSYIRESSPRQARADRYGPDVQRASIRQFCEQWGLGQPDKEYFDTYSGRRLAGRSQLQLAVGEAEAGEYDVLLCYHTSRSFRNRHEAAISKSTLRAAGVTLVFTQQGMISGDPRNKVIEGVYEVLDENYSDTMGMFIGAGLRQKFEKGGVNGVPPLGYRRFKGEDGNPKNGSLEVDERGKATVRAIAELYLTGEHSTASIALRLNQERGSDGERLYATRLGEPLTKGSVEEVLRNRTYLGLTVWRPGTDEEDVRPGNHEPLITQEEWDAIQEIRGRRTTRTGRRPSSRAYPLSRPACCFHCGASFAGDTGGRCGKRRLRHAVSVACENRRSFMADGLEAQFSAFLSTRLWLPDDWRARYLQLLRHAEPGSRGADEVKQKSLEKRLDRVRDLYKMGDISRAEYTRERDEIRRQLSANAPNLISRVSINMDRAAQLLADAGTLWAHPGVSPQLQEAFVDELFERIDLDEAGLRSVTPRREYAGLVAMAALEGWGGYGRGDWI